MLKVDVSKMWRGRHKSLASKRQQRGFTIVELMVATAAFSVIMLVAAATVVRFTTNYQRSLTQNTTQNTARSVIDTVSQSLQFSRGGASPSGPDGGGCRGYFMSPFQYDYILGRQVTDAQHALVERPAMNPSGACELTNGKELLSPNMRLVRFNITQRGDVFDVTIRIAYGEKDLLCDANKAGSCTGSAELDDADIPMIGETPPNDIQCKAQKGSQYCAISELSTTVQSRL